MDWVQFSGLKICLHTLLFSGYIPLSAWTWLLPKFDQHTPGVLRCVVMNV